ncbi:MAG TPA: SDR family oxidoreductase [Ktedonobacteraceae bacterium]|nr:SDR family oxidoreductase [Ktedonobacteraceae bacterium]
MSHDFARQHGSSGAMHQAGMATRRSLLQRRVLVVGAAGAFGSGIAQALRERGARVMGIDRVSRPDIVVADITDDEAVRSAVQQVLAQIGGLDVLINTAGVGPLQDAGAPPGESVMQALSVNLLGPWRVASYALPALIESRGRIINVAFGLTFANVPFASPYTASKRALTAWSEVLRLEYGSHVGVTTIYPGYIKTPIHAQAEAEGVSLSGLVREEPLSAMIKTVVRACTGKPRRDLATTRLGNIEIGLARHFPAFADRVILQRMQQLARQKRYANAPLTFGMLKRMGFKN